jgi:hypothetical protein
MTIREDSLLKVIIRIYKKNNTIFNYFAKIREENSNHLYLEFNSCFKSQNEFFTRYFCGI